MPSQEVLKASAAPAVPSPVGARYVDTQPSMLAILSVSSSRSLMAIRQHRVVQSLPVGVFKVCGRDVKTGILAG